MHGKEIPKIVKDKIQLLSTKKFWLEKLLEAPYLQIYLHTNINITPMNRRSI
jgi:hypothetical protein